MATTSLVTAHSAFTRVELSEQDYEGLLRTFAPRIFPEYQWFEFRPPVSSIYGVAHPDAALISTTGTDWWVVEIELARHSVREHVELQLSKLREGWFSSTELRYISARHPEAAGLLTRINAREPRFLVVVDDVSTGIESIATQLDFEVLHLLPFISSTHLYAGAIEGHNPVTRRARVPGLPLTLRSDMETARLSLARMDSILPALPREILVGTRLVRLWGEGDGTGIVLALSRNELIALLGDSSYYILMTRAGEIAELAIPPGVGA